MEKRQTIQRQIILDAVKTLNCHATAEEVYAFVHRTQPTISKATVYRNLSQMAQYGDLLNIGHFNGATHYDHNCHTHYHFVCNVCRRVYDVEGDFSDVLAKAAQNDSHEMTRLFLSFAGVCKICKERA
ncbi:MAG: transcriptional repressor [Defluviitaleaceae bacterium]|nr:transcriptional repressor [Defluviitaleaceae bacterium]MCL2274519.1 transcriptional repressor [Defluviitaleaceae bacterium]